MQISYLVGVGLLLTIDLLACVHSQGMLYHNSILVPKYYVSLVSIVESWDIVPQG